MLYKRTTKQKTINLVYKDTSSVCVPFLDNNALTFVLENNNRIQNETHLSSVLMTIQKLLVAQSIYYFSVVVLLF